MGRQLYPLLLLFGLILMCFLNYLALDNWTESERVVPGRFRRADPPRQSECSPKKRPLEGGQSSRAEAIAPCVRKRTDIMDCVTQDISKLKPECMELLSPDFNHPVTLSVYADKRRKDFPMSLRVPPEWLLKYPSMEYSESARSIMCRECSMGLAGKLLTLRGSGELVTKPLLSFGDSGLKKIKTHLLTSYHYVAEKRGKALYNGGGCFPQIAEDIVLPEAEKEFEEGTLGPVARLAEIVLLLLRQGLPLRGDKYTSYKTFDPATHDIYSSTPWQYSNFDAAFLSRLHGGDNLLKNFIKQAPRNANYLSFQSQNKMANLAAGMIKEEILNEARNSSFFAILLDGTTDSAGKEQLAVVLRYLLDDKIEESFVEFIDVSNSTKGVHLLDVVETAMADYGLDMQKLRGQGYDGGSPMAAKIKGLQARIRQKYPKAVYIHCQAHQINLALLKSVKLAVPDLLIAYLASSGKFFKTPRMHTVLEASINRTTGVQGLSIPAMTRWTSLNRVNQKFLLLHNYTIDAYDTIREDTETFDGDARKSAQHLKKMALTVAVVYISQICRLVLGDLSKLTETLEKRDQEYSVAIRAINSTITKFEQYLADLNSQSDYTVGWWNDTRILLEAYNVTFQDNIFERIGYEATTARPFLAEIIKQMDARFNTQEEKLVLMEKLIPKRLLETKMVASDFQLLIDEYKSDLPDHEHFPEQLALWREYCESGMSNNEATETVAGTLADFTEGLRLKFSVIYTLLKIYAVIPVTTASPERMFSYLKLIKTRIRTKMSQQLLNAASLLYISKTRVVDPRAVAIQFLLQSKMAKVWFADGTPGDVPVPDCPQAMEELTDEEILEELGEEVLEDSGFYDDISEMPFYPE